MSFNRKLAEHRAAASRQVLVDTLLQLLEQPRETDVSYREIAEAAGVSERTVFRYFENRDALRDAVIPSIHARLDGIEPPHTLPELLTYPARLFTVCERSSGLVRSLLHTDLGRSILAVERQRRLDGIKKLLLTMVPQKQQSHVLEAAANIRHIVSGVGWEFFRFQVGLTLPRAIESADWALRSMLVALGVRVPLVSEVPTTAQSSDVPSTTRASRTSATDRGRARTRARSS